jgi:hypothetical protein
MEKINLGTKRAATMRRALAQKNKKFLKLTRKEQRVAIAEDVIAQVRAKKFVAASVYFKLGRANNGCDEVYSTPEFDLTDNTNADLSECIAAEGCTVCGIGSLFASAVLNADRLKVKKVASHQSVCVGRGDEVHYLRKWFDADQLNLIEDYYEQESWRESTIYDEDDDSKRLIMIMQNIIGNKGVFDPSKGPHKDYGENNE